MLRALAAALLSLLSLVATAAGLVELDSHLPGIWLPIAFASIIFLLLGMLPRMGPGRIPYAASVGAGVLEAWLYTREKLPTEKLDRFSHAAPLATLVVGGVAVVWWVGALLASSKRPSSFWLLVLALCCCTVAYFSSAKGDAGPMQEILARLLGISFGSAHLATVVLRKSIHVAFYGCLGLFALLAAKGSGAKTPALFALLVALSCASFDEYRQSFFPGRTSSVYDVALDSAGAGTFILLGSIGKSRRRSVKTATT